MVQKVSVGILGGTGMVGRRLAQLLIGHPWFELKAVIGQGSIGEPYRDVWNRKERAVSTHYGSDFWREVPFPAELDHCHVLSLAEGLEDKGIEVLFAAVSAEGQAAEQQALDRGRRVFSNSPYGRFDDENPLVITEVNGERIAEARFVKNPNCVTSGAVMILDALAPLGLEGVAVTTFQSLSGRGDAKYPVDLVSGNVYPLHGSEERTEEYIAREIHKILDSDVPVSVSCNRVFVQEGHFVDLRIKTSRRPDVAELAALLEGYNPLKNVPLPSKPARPLVVCAEAGRPRPNQDCFHERGFSVAVGNLCTTDAMFEVRLQYVVNNLIRGAAGSALLNAEYSYLLTH
ncbi:Asd/ArgC dimerization domain-containing protein [Variovorax sp. EL159]|uniref:Asd/ArgC dimerization domain-containing protein n=1 Tax=unclassified Variovorax TaxID=663243 RepID=UPI00087EDF65|nr:Asd/ArgC dimerization domain-containing protein [Variovorax sp. EL159]SCX72858.1 aspartate-semialdehyde dehydrogenase [Variovorax sp. EL159]